MCLTLNRGFILLSCALPARALPRGRCSFGALCHRGPGGRLLEDRRLEGGGELGTRGQDGMLAQRAVLLGWLLVTPRLAASTMQSFIGEGDIPQPPLPKEVPLWGRGSRSGMLTSSPWGSLRLLQSAGSWTPRLQPRAEATASRVRCAWSGLMSGR